MTALRIDHLDSPVGRITLVVHGDTLCALDFFDPEGMRESLSRRYDELELTPAEDPAGMTSRLRAYFEGRLDAIEEVPVEMGGTPFQQRVWKALQDVPCGQTRSYRDIATAIGQPTATRAVGAANGRNPIGIVVPCHRVVAADKRLGGYSGGLDNKRWLLTHEGALLA
jgi:methylated-DNA-[protein]-cysteine S-methyltransferase